LTVADFRSLAADAKHKEAEHREKLAAPPAAGRRQRVKDLIEHHVSEEAGVPSSTTREAAAAKFMLLRFPNQLCSDGGRAINVTDPGWPATLRGEAAKST
jgi:hypothetical protein